ncbi:hypothetical protein BC835DRAFT_409073 [Cytidiella melzeri]|nr:hypothetical protein BC835DRAFT_409073 [Cytidiella melzeri]
MSIVLLTKLFATLNLLLLRLCRTTYRMDGVFRVQGVNDWNESSISAFHEQIEYPSQHLSLLVHSTHFSLLLNPPQPSTVFLALWHIVRFPLFFGPLGLGNVLTGTSARSRRRFESSLLARQICLSTTTPEGHSHTSC